MRIFIITNEPFPHGMAATKRISCYAKSLVMQGDECEVLIFHRTEVYRRKPRNIQGSGEIDGYRFRYVGGTPLRGSNVLIRRYCDYRDKINTLHYLKQTLRQGDVVLLYLGESFSFTTKLIHLCHSMSVPIIRELCEYPYGTQEESEERIAKRQRYLNDIFPQFDGAICISEALYQLAMKYCPHGHHIKIPILVEEPNTREKHQHDYPYIFHGGTLLERKDAIVSTMKAYAMACQQIKDRIDFILIGPPSPHQDELNAIIHENHLEDRVHFLPQMDQEEIASYQNGAFLTILNKNDNMQNRCGFSTKLGEILMSETPVITTTVGEANNWLEDGESAYIVEPHHPEKIAEKIAEVFEDEEKRAQIARKGKEIAKMHFSLTFQGERFHQYLDILTQEKKRH